MSNNVNLIPPALFAIYITPFTPPLHILIEGDTEYDGDTQCSCHILYDLTEYGMHTKYGVTPETKNVDGRQTDVGHINLIVGLVTRNPPKNSLQFGTLNYCRIIYWH